MALRKNVKSQVETTLPEISIDRGLLSRIEKISEQTGLDTSALLQKWILQEETLIGFMQHSKEQAATQTTPSLLDVSPQEVPEEQEKTGEINPATPDYRKILVERAKELKKEGKTLVKIAEIFNEENLQTVSGKGKWYSSSIVNLLNSKM